MHRITTMNELEELRRENFYLRAKLEQVTQERDELKAKLSDLTHDEVQEAISVWFEGGFY